MRTVAWRRDHLPPFGGELVRKWKHHRRGLLQFRVCQAVRSSNTIQGLGSNRNLRRVSEGLPGGEDKYLFVQTTLSDRSPL